MCKLNKLDIIETRINEVFTTLSSIQRSLSYLEDDIENLKTKTGKMEDVVKELEESVDFNAENISDLKRDTKGALKELNNLRKQILFLETCSRRKNAIFHGIEEMESSGDSQQLLEDTREVMYNFTEEHFGIENPQGKIEFQRIHRLGKFNPGKTYPIIARFLTYSDKESVMDKARQKLKGKDFYISDDIPKPLYEARKNQMNKFKDAKKKGYSVHFNKAHPDNLYVNGKYIAPDTPID